MGNKRFEEWIKIKEKLHLVGRTPHILEGEIWWSAVGENVGVEINGKGDVFSRPVLIMKKHNKYSFMAIPLTSQSKQGSWYVDFVFKHKKETAIIVQAENMSVSRLYKKIGQIPFSDLEKVRQGFINYYK